MKTRKTNNTIMERMQDDGPVGNPAGINVKSEGFQNLKKAIRERAAAMTPAQRIEIQLNAVKFRMKSYLQEPEPQYVSTGQFLKECLGVTGVQLKYFASYLDSNSGNVSKLLTGERKINPETAVILGNTFNTEPELWLQVQDKNQILELKHIKKDQFSRYSLNNLLQCNAKR